MGREMKNSGVMNERFNEIYDKYCRLVMEIALSILEKHELAEDAMQATFISVARNLKKIDPDPKKTKNYIAVTAHNMALKILKCEQKRRKNEVPFTDEEQGDDERRYFGAWKKKDFTIESFEEDILRKYDRIRLLEALGSLDDKYAEYIKDYYYEDMSIRQIAEKHNIKDDAAKKRIYRSVDKLREIFMKKGG